jgi:GNAT superfamily N-acetyltransferase
MKVEKEHITRNLQCFYTRVAELNGFERGKVTGIAYVWNRNGYWPSYLLGVPGIEKIPELVRAIELEKAPPFCIAENSRREETDLLEESGIRSIREWKGMYLDSRMYDADSMTEDIPQAQLRINDQESLDDWLMLVNEELMSGIQIEKPVIKSLSDSDEFRFVVAYSEGNPAGAGLSFREGGICGLYMIATRAPMRGQGIGSLVTTSLIEHAVNMNDEGIVLHATALGEQLYSRLGFREINRYSVMWYLGK